MQVTLNVTDSLSGDQAEQLSKDGDIQIVRSPGASLLAVTFNVRKDPFKNKDARYAVSYAIAHAWRTEELRLTTPSVTRQPAIAPTFDTRMTWRISTEPVTVSRFSGESMPDIAALISSIAS